MLVSSIFAIWFVQHLTKALITAPWGHSRFNNSWERDMDLLMSICLYGCQSSIHRCIYCIHAAGMFTTLVFSVSQETAGRGSLALFHIFPMASARNCLQVAQCLFVPLFKCFFCFEFSLLYFFFFFSCSNEILICFPPAESECHVIMLTLFRTL